MNSVKITPKYPFSFNNWSHGYIFQPLFFLNSNESNEFTISFTIIDESIIWLINVILISKSSIASKEPIDISFKYFRLEKNSNFLKSDDPPIDVQSIVNTKIIEYLGLNDDFQPFYKFVMEFETLQPLINLIPGYRLSGVLATDWMPVLAYLSTNTTVEMYHRFLKDFLRYWGLKINNSTKILPSFPPLDLMSHIQEQEYRKTKIGYRAKYMQELIHSFVIEPNIINHAVDNQVLLKNLMKIKGIGEYSARTILLYGQKDYTVGFVDSFVKILLNEYFGVDKKLPNKSLMEIIDKKFYPFQGLMIDWLTAVYSETNFPEKEKILSFLE
jgi:3-methyladenine DNA glycosylase/8-oxoguanine DNA glycosylase